MKNTAAVVLIFFFLPKVLAQPAFSGTVFVDPDIIRETDPTIFAGIQSLGVAERQTYDRREGSWITEDMFLFEANFRGVDPVEVQVNLEYGSEESAEQDALFFAEAVGRLPRLLFRDLSSITIHKGDEAFGGGNNNILIHSEANGYIKDGWLEETLVHEGVHTSMDGRYASSEGWINSQNDDSLFISTYAEDYPGREDMAESFLMWMASEYRRSRVSAATLSTIENAIPARLSFFNSLNLDMYPVASPTSDLHKDVGRVIRTDGTATESKILISSSLNQGEAYSTSFANRDQIIITAKVLPDADDVGSEGELYVVIRERESGKKVFKALNQDGVWEVWNASLKSLPAARYVANLQASEELTVYSGTMTAGQRLIYVGYSPYTDDKPIITTSLSPVMIDVSE
jgi:hypothetical protein